MVSDFRYALRTLAKAPGFSLVAVLTLALGIGANTAIFSVVYGVLLKPLPFGDPGGIVQVWSVTRSEPHGAHSAADFLDLQRESRALAALAGYRRALFTAMVDAGEPLQFDGAYVTADFFDVLRVSPALGRTFTRDVDAKSPDRLVVLADGAWRQLFGTVDGVGRRIRLDGEPYTVAGVLPPRSEWPEATRLWVLSPRPVPPSPLDIAGAVADRDVRYFEALARVKPGVSIPQAQDDLNRVAAAIEQRHPQTAAGRGVRIVPIRERLVGDVRPALLILQGAVGLVLLIACANVAGLLIARATGRSRELAIRAALGASRARLLRQLLIESLVLGTAGGLAGLLAGAWLVVFLISVLPAGVPRTAEVSLDRVVALVTMAIAVGTSVLSGVLPALRASRADAGVALTRGGERTSPARERGRAVLVVAEVALTLILLASAGLLMNSFLRLQRVDSGFRPERVTLMSLAVPQSRYPTGTSQAELYRRLIDGLAERPEVQAVGVGFPGPLRGSTATATFFIEGWASSSRADRPFANIGSVSGGYFAAVGIPLLAGRTFAPTDARNAAGVAIVSDALARKYWPGEHAVGKRLRFDDDPREPWATVVGIVGDARQLGLHEPAPPILYMTFEQFPLPFTNLAVRTSATASGAAALLRAQLKSVDPQMPPGAIASLQTILDRSIAEPRFRSLVLAAFAVAALILAAVGVYGLVSYSVAQRTREIGIRVALGAQPGHVMRSVVREGLTLAAAGLVIGLAGALAAARTLSRFLSGIDATDPLTFTAVSAILLFVAAGASYVPSRRALRVDPMTALRTE